MLLRSRKTSHLHVATRLLYSLALPLASLPTSAQEKPAPTNTQPVLAPIDQAQKDFDREVALFNRQGKITTESYRFSKKVELNIKNAPLRDIVDEITKQLPKVKEIEIRSAQPVQLTFNLKASAGSILRSAAALAGCEYALMPYGLVLAPRKELSRDELIYSQQNPADPQSDALFAKQMQALADELSQKPTGSSSLRQLSPTSLKFCAAWLGKSLANATETEKVPLECVVALEKDLQGQWMLVFNGPKYKVMASPITVN